MVLEHQHLRISILNSQIERLDLIFELLNLYGADLCKLTTFHNFRWWILGSLILGWVRIDLLALLLSLGDLSLLNLSDSILSCQELQTFDIFWANIALAGVLRINEILELALKEFMDDPIIRWWTTINTQFQPLKLTLSSVKLGQKLIVRQPSVGRLTVLTRGGSRLQISHRRSKPALSLHKLSLSLGQFQSETVNFFFLHGKFLKL